MNEAVFISDLHLGPDTPEIAARFQAFIKWAANNARTLYILGDLFHAWVGDDDNAPWSDAIIANLAWLSEQGVKTYFIHGNRDFLLGERFSVLAKIEYLNDPTAIQLGGQRVLLSHGDRYCTKDYAHQLLMFLTRNRLFTWGFLKLSLKTRQRIVAGMRRRSLKPKSKSIQSMDVVKAALLKDLRALNAKILVHGHTHRTGITEYDEQGVHFLRYVMSDWDDTPTYLCYHAQKAFFLSQI